MLLPVNITWLNLLWVFHKSQHVSELWNNPREAQFVNSLWCSGFGSGNPWKRQQIAPSELLELALGSASVPALFKDLPGIAHSIPCQIYKFLNSSDHSGWEECTNGVADWVLIWDVFNFQATLIYFHLKITRLASVLHFIASFNTSYLLFFFSWTIRSFQCAVTPSFCVFDKWWRSWVFQ